MIKHKISLILTICFASILLISIVTLSILQTNTKPNLPNPDSIKIYKQSTTASATYQKGTEDYNEIIKLYNSMFEKTYLNQLADNDILGNEIVEDVYASLWTDINTETGLFVEFIFDSQKKYIIYRDGNSRRVEISSIVFQLSKENSSNKLYIYYKLPKQTGDVKEALTNEPCYPLVTQANTYELYKYIISKD